MIHQISSNCSEIHKDETIVSQNGWYGMADGKAYDVTDLLQGVVHLQTLSDGHLFSLLASEICVVTIDQLQVEKSFVLFF